MSNEASLARRIQQASKPEATLLSQAFLNLTKIYLALDNDVTRHDYGRALAEFIGDFLGDDRRLDHVAKRERPPSTPADDRLLYLRVTEQGEDVARTLRGTLAGINMIQGILAGIDQGLSDEMFDAYLRLCAHLGIPTMKEYEANPELYPGVMNGEKYFQGLGFGVTAAR